MNCLVPTFVPQWRSGAVSEESNLALRSVTEGAGPHSDEVWRAAGGLLPGAVRLQSANQQDVEPLEHGQSEANSGHQRVPAH